MQSGGHLSSNPPLHRFSTLRAKNCLDVPTRSGQVSLGKGTRVRSEARSDCRTLQKVGAVAVCIEHVCSVLGLAAKPIVDIDIYMNSIQAMDLNGHRNVRLERKHSGRFSIRGGRRVVCSFAVETVAAGVAGDGWLGRYLLLGRRGNRRLGCAFDCRTYWSGGAGKGPAVNKRSYSNHVGIAAQ